MVIAHKPRNYPYILAELYSTRFPLVLQLYSIFFVYWNRLGFREYSEKWIYRMPREHEDAYVSCAYPNKALHCPLVRTHHKVYHEPRSIVISQREEKSGANCFTRFCWIFLPYVARASQNIFSVFSRIVSSIFALNTNYRRIYWNKSQNKS